MKKINVGIDLGTTYSAVAYFDEGTSKIQILKNEIGEETTPSVVYVENGQELIGQEAKDLQASGNTNTASFYKSQMGEPNFSAYLDGKDYSAEDLSAIFLKNLKKQIEQANNIEIDGVVITCPAYFNEAQRQATIHAGERAGLKVLKILNEPTAAIIAYGLTGVGTRNVMVYDLGGGTFDVTIAKIEGAKVTPLCTNGNHQLGGRDWDRALIDYVVSKFNDEFGIDITAYPEDFNELMVKCEKAKKVLTNVPTTTIAIQCDGMYGKYEISRDDFDRATENLLNETMLLTEQCFSEIGGGFSWKNLDEVVLVGGSTRMPQISKAVETQFGKKPRIIGNKVDSIVAAGAAMQAHLSQFGSLTLNPVNLGMANFGNNGEKPMAFTLTNNNIKDITSHSLGLLVWENEDSDKLINSIVIKKNSNVGEDFDKEYTYQGEKMEAYVLQGENTDPYDANILYKYEITGFPSGKNQVVVSYLYNQNGVVEVKAKIKGGASLNVKQCPVTETLSEIEARLKKEKAENARANSFDVTFMIDVSGSMYGSGIAAAIQAVDEFVNQIDLTKTRVSLISFANSCKMELNHEQNKSRIMSAAKGLIADGGTDADPFNFYLSKYSMSAGAAPKPRFSLKSAFGGGSVQVGNEIIIVLTDGEWWRANDAISSANKVKGKGVTVYAVGVADSNQSFLNQIASPGCAKKVDLSQLVSTFKSIGSSLASGN